MCFIIVMTLLRGAIQNINYNLLQFYSVLLSCLTTSVFGQWDEFTGCWDDGTFEHAPLPLQISKLMSFEHTNSSDKKSFFLSLCWLEPYTFWNRYTYFGTTSTILTSWVPNKVLSNSAFNRTQATYHCFFILSVLSAFNGTPATQH